MNSTRACGSCTSVHMARGAMQSFFLFVRAGCAPPGKEKKLEFLVRTMLRHFASTIKRGGLTLSKRTVANGGIVRTAHRPRTTLVMASQEGQIQSELMESMRSKIQTALDAQSVSVSDVQGDGRHVEIVVVSSQFEGQNSVNRQRMVYKAIWEELQDVVHAVRLSSSSSSQNKTGTLLLSHVIACDRIPCSQDPSTSLSTGRLHGLQDPQ